MVEITCDCETADLSIIFFTLKKEKKSYFAYSFFLCRTNQACQIIQLKMRDDRQSDPYVLAMLQAIDAVVAVIFYYH